MSAGTPKRLKMESSENIFQVHKYQILPIPDRGINQEIAEKYEIRTKVSGEDGTTHLAHYFPYCNDKGSVVGYKKRDLLKSKKNSFSAIGEVSEKSMPFGYQTLGKDKWKLIVCEGEYDAAFAHRAIQSYNRKKGYEDKGIHVVSIATGAPNAASFLMAHTQLLRQYKEVVLVFDNDEAGLEAVNEVSLALPDYPIKYVKLPLKDPIEMFEAKRHGEMVQDILFNAMEYKPETLVTVEGTQKEFDEISKPLPRGQYIDFLPNLSDCLKGLRENEMSILLAPTKCGKAQLNSDILPTPDGYKKVGDVRVGDFLFSQNGYPTKVLEVFPQGVTNNFEITFSDNTTAMCCENHLWNVKTEDDRKRNKPYRTMSVKEILKRDNLWRSNGLDKRKSLNYSIPLCKPVNYSNKDLLVDPYTLGFLLGDGYLNPVTTFSANVSLLDGPYYFSELEGLSSITKNKGIHTLYFNSEIRDDIESLGLRGKLSGDKFVPDEYLLGSVEQRKALLAGLLDTDGTVEISKNKKVTKFSSTSKALCQAVVELVQSLGGIASMSLDTRDKYKSGFCGVVNIQTSFNPFRLPRKKQKWDSVLNTFKPYKKIKSIKYIGQEETTCFMVSAKDSLYLCRYYIVTHNSSIARQMAFELGKKGNKVGMFFLEESAKTTKQHLIALYNGVRPATFMTDPTCVPEEKRWEALNWMKEHYIFHDASITNEIINTDDICKTVKHCVLLGYKYIMFDHISFVLSGDTDGNERKKIDNLLHTLSIIARNYPVHIWAIAHITRNKSFSPERDPETKEIIYPYWLPVKKEDGRGSGAFEQLAHNIICLEPQICDEDGTKGNVRLVVRANRTWGEERVCDELTYDSIKGVLS